MLMRIYHVCQCCDQIFKITEPLEGIVQGDGQSLTGIATGSIIKPKSGRGAGYTVDLCDECREEVYGSPEWLILPHRLH